MLISRRVNQNWLFPNLTRRAAEGLSEMRSELPSARPGRTLLLHDGGETRWYTFAGLRANLELAARIAPLRTQISQRNNLYIAFGNTVDRDHLRAALQQPTSEAELARLVADVSGPLKLQRALPEKLVDEILVGRLRDTTAVSRVVEAPIDQSTPDLGD